MNSEEVGYEGDGWYGQPVTGEIEGFCVILFHCPLDGKQFKSGHAVCLKRIAVKRRKRYRPLFGTH